MKGKPIDVTGMWSVPSKWSTSIWLGFTGRLNVHSAEETVRQKALEEHKPHWLPTAPRNR